jgi:ATP-dependent exoDNAse (exonuclease V) beta subunit
MEPKYSILFFCENLNEQYNRIEQLLHTGMKVFWFGTSEEAEYLKRNLKAFIMGFFLQVFDVQEVSEQNLPEAGMILDGANILTGYGKHLLDWLEEWIPAFNAAQYRVEHCAADANIVVKASAGTGKTTVMIDRILYLMHMNQNLNMSEIYMITFTNEATNQMNDRLQEMLLKKYSLTKNKRYLTWLEQQSQMHISTIDSLAYDLFRRFGTSVGFGRDLAIRPLEKERKDLMKDILSDALNDQHSIAAQTGMNFSTAAKVIDEYWKEFTKKGYSITDILKKDWGKEEDGTTEAAFQQVLRAVLGKIEKSYQQLKLDANGISIHDLFFDFGHYLLEERLDCTGLDMRYLFVDEFQDTDVTQIRTFARMVQKIGAHLFVVGDVKQSIYAFKGATDKAFDILEEEMQGRLLSFNLRNNYRTSSNLMKVMEQYFFAWADEELLQYEEPVRPFKEDVGEVYMELAYRKAEIPKQTIHMIKDALESLELDIRSGRKKLTGKTKVAVLVRGNTKAAEIAELCREHGLTVVLNSDQPFFLSQAVRDFYAMISSFLFAEQPVYIYNYLMTPYAVYDGSMSIREMDGLQGDVRNLQDYLKKYLVQTDWHYYQREFRIRPVLAVIREMIEKENIIEHFIALDKVHMYGDEWTEAKKNKQALIDARRYQVNLNKLLEMLQQRMEGEFTTLYDIYVYLSLMIATNREEMEPDIDLADDYTSVYIMTVHKSKGLEFDTVVMPAMNNSLTPPPKTRVLVNEKCVAWFYRKNMQENMHSVLYEALNREEEQKCMEEETRMLYVAMTRAVNKLMLLVNDWDAYESWSTLIRRVGLINE